MKKLALLLLPLALLCVASEYPQGIRDAWHKWVVQYNTTMTDPDKAIGMSFDGYAMSPTMSHKKAAWQHARLNYLLGRYDENPAETNRAALLKELAAFTVTVTNTPAKAPSTP